MLSPKNVARSPLPGCPGTYRPGGSSWARFSRYLRPDQRWARGRGGDRLPPTGLAASPSPEGYGLGMLLSNFIQIFIQHLCTYYVLLTPYHSHAHPNTHTEPNFSMMAQENRLWTALGAKQSCFNNSAPLLPWMRSLNT